MIALSRDCHMTVTHPGPMPKGSYRRQKRKIVIRERERTTDLSYRNTYVQNMTLYDPIPMLCLESK